MSNVWGTRYRLLAEQIVKLADQFSRGDPIASAAPKEQAVRLLAIIATLLQQHHINQRGQCRYCGWTRWGWRVWRRRPRCTVYQAADFLLGQSLDVVWWQLLASTGRERSLPAVRAWLEQGGRHAHQLAVHDTDPDDAAV